MCPVRLPDLAALAQKMQHQQRCGLLCESQTETWRWGQACRYNLKQWINNSRARSKSTCFSSAQATLSQAFCLALSHVPGGGFSVDIFSALHVHSFYFSKVPQGLLECTANRTPPRSFLPKNKAVILTFRRLSALLFIHVVLPIKVFLIIFLMGHHHPLHL